MKWICENCKYSCIEQKRGFKVLRCSLGLDQAKVDRDRRCSVKIKELEHISKRF